MPMRSEPSLLRCAGCGAVWVSQRGELIAELGEPCLRCGGSLVVEDQVDSNVGVVRKLWDAWSSDVEARPVISLLVRDYPAVYHGHAGLRRWFEDCADAWEASPRELRAFDDRVLALGRLVRKKRSTGEDAAQDVAWVFRIRERKMISCLAYLDPEIALASLGVEVRRDVNGAGTFSDIPWSFAESPESRCRDGGSDQ